MPNDNILPRSASTNKENNYIIEKSQDLLYIYPNPVRDVLTVEYALLTEVSINSLGIYDINGKLIKSIVITEQLGITKINVSNLANGTYILSFGKDGIKSYSKKFTVKQ